MAARSPIRVPHANARGTAQSEAEPRNDPVRTGAIWQATSSFPQNAVVGNGHLRAGMEVVTKPFVVADLGRKVRDLLDQ
jgi:hypothetical protein